MTKLQIVHSTNSSYKYLHPKILKGAIAFNETGIS